MRRTGYPQGGAPAARNHPGSRSRGGGGLSQFPGPAGDSFCSLAPAHPSPMLDPFRSPKGSSPRSKSEQKPPNAEPILPAACRAPNNAHPTKCYARFRCREMTHQLPALRLPRGWLQMESTTSKRQQLTKDPHMLTGIRIAAKGSGGKVGGSGKGGSGKGQGNAGGWPSTTGNPSGGGRSNAGTGTGGK